MKYDVIIIGAGPGGIFSAYEMVQRSKDVKIAVFEAGHALDKRHCPIDGVKVKSCVNCKSCSIMSGFGGAGAFSDGKYNITNAFGGTLYEYIGRSQAIDLMKYVDDINMKFGGEGTKLYSTSGTAFKKICLQNKLNLLDASVRHLGTDINLIVLGNLYAELKDKVYEMAARLAASAPLAIGLTKKYLNNTALTLDEVLAIEETTQALLMGTDDCKEGIAAFYEKRAPQFTGK